MVLQDVCGLRSEIQLDTSLWAARARTHDNATMLYRASRHDCIGCALKLVCSPNTPTRKVPRSIHEGARDLARQIC